MSESKSLNYLNLHVLISHSPACLNRDDMNMQKSAMFGGVRRVRISSQSLKRAIRKSDYYRDYLGEPSVRTRDLKKLKDKFAQVPLLKEKYSRELIDEVIDRIAGTGKFLDDKKKKDKNKGESTKAERESQAVAPWSVGEVDRICEIVSRAKEQGLDEKVIEKQVKEAARALCETLAQCALDIALSGRMATSGLMNPVDGALAVAHVITTHAVDSEVDWFTAVDDLTEEDNETGAGHLNTQEFGAGVFYRYASLNIGQMRESLGGASRQEVLDKAAHLLYLFSTIVPSAKQNTFAAHNPADLVLASFSAIPLSLANAFETPVRRDVRGGFITPSIRSLETYLEKVHKGYGLTEASSVFSLWDTSFQPRMASVIELMEWVRSDGGRP